MLGGNRAVALQRCS